MLCVLLPDRSGYAQQPDSLPNRSEIPAAARDSAQQRLRREFAQYLKNPSGKAVSFRGRIEVGARQTFLQNSGALEQPSNYVRFGGQGTLTVFGIPLSLGSTISTEQVPFRQPMNLLNIGLDGDQLRRNLQDRTRRLAEARSRGMLSQLPTQIPDEIPEAPRAPSEDEMRAKIQEKLSAEAQRKYQQMQDSAAYYRTYSDSLDRVVDERTSTARTMNDVSKIDSLRREASAKRERAEAMRDSAMAIYAQADQQYETARRKYETAKAQYEQRRRDLDSLRQIGLYQLPNPSDTLGTTIQNAPNDLISRAERILSGVEIFKVGRMVVNTTRFTVWGAPITGAQLAVRPIPKLYLEALGSKNLDRTDRPPTTGVIVNPTRDLGMLRVGWGERNKAYVRLNMMYAEDRKNTIPRDGITRLILPQQNAVVSVDFRVPINQDKIMLEGEVATSVHSRDTEFQRFGLGEIPNLSVQQSGAQGVIWNDKAITLRGVLQPWKGSRVSILGNQVGTGFRTLGNAFMRTDYRNGQFDIEQTLLKNKLRLSGLYGLERNNLLQLLASTVHRQTMGGGFTVTPIQSLQLNTQFTNTRMTSQLDSTGATLPGIDQSTISSTINHTTRLGNWNLTELYSVMYLTQQSPSELLQYTTWNHNAVITARHRKGWQLGSQGQRTTTANSILPIELTTVSVSAGYTSPKHWMVTNALAYTTSKGRGERYTGILDVRLGLTKWLMWNTRVEYSRIVLVGGAFGLSTGTTGLVATW
jgi:hypothetical protein